MFDPCGWTSRLVGFTLRKPVVLPLLEERRDREGLRRRAATGHRSKNLLHLSNRVVCFTLRKPFVLPLLDDDEGDDDDDDDGDGDDGDDDDD